MSGCQCPLKSAARDAPNALAFVSKEKSLTFQEMDELAEKFCLELHKTRVQPGDRIAILHPSSHEWICFFFAVLRLGASICPLNLRLPPAQVQNQIVRIAPKLFVQSFPWEPIERDGCKSDAVHKCVLLFTSGSTGIPKIAVLSFASLLTNASHSIPLEMGDRYLLTLPLYHVGGLGIVLRCMLRRATIVMNENDPEITHISFVPTQLYRTIPIYKNLKCLLLGGAPISTFPERLPIYATYGLTEMGSMVLTRKHPLQKEGCFFLGTPLPNRKMRLSEDGQIWVGGETLFRGYLEEEGIFSPAIDGWFPTGDIGKKDATEGFCVLGRKDWQFISGGENIQPEEIETHLLQIPGIVEAVVIPKDDPEYGKRPIALIRTTSSRFSTDKVRSILKDRLPKYKIPASIHLVPEIPKMGMKPDRRKALLMYLPRYYFEHQK